MKTETVGGVTTTPDYWDCECEKNYIHPKNQKTCTVCKAEASDSPDSRVDELPKCAACNNSATIRTYRQRNGCLSKYPECDKHKLMDDRTFFSSMDRHGKKRAEGGK